MINLNIKDFENLQPHLGKKRDEEILKIKGIKNLTLQILTHFQTISDRILRPDIQEAAAGGVEKIPKSPKDFPHHYRPFRREARFLDKDKDYDEPIRMKHVGRKILNAMRNIFFGCEFAKKYDNKRDLEIIKKEYFYFEKIWIGLNEHYTKKFNKEMQKAFTQADLLLKDRQNYVRQSLYQRITLLALGAFTLTSHALGKRSSMLLGLAISSLTFTFILIHYAKTSFRQTRLANELKNSVVGIRRMVELARVD